MTEKIQEFLTKFDDQHLANLQCAAEDGTLGYRDPCNCLLHHHKNSYSQTKWDGDLATLARQAETEFFYLGGKYDERVDGGPLAWAPKGDAIRREAILPLIHAEWANRAKQIKEIEELTPVSSSVR